MHFPGAGVGGHCIPKDPWLLSYGVKNKDVPLRLIPAARAVNDSMPIHIGKLLQNALESKGKDIKGANVLVLGYSYLEESDDIRNSPSKVLVDYLDEKGAQVSIHDPWIAEYNTDVMELLKACDAVVLMVAHSFYRSLDLTNILAESIPVIDGRNILPEAMGEKLGYYRKLGKDDEK